MRKGLATRNWRWKGRGVWTDHSQLQIFHLDCPPKCDKCWFLQGLLQCGIWNWRLWFTGLRPFQTSCWNVAFNAWVLSSGAGIDGLIKGLEESIGSLFWSFMVTFHHYGEKFAKNKHCAIGKGWFGHKILEVLVYHLKVSLSLGLCWGSVMVGSIGRTAASTSVRNRGGEEGCGPGSSSRASSDCKTPC